MSRRYSGSILLGALGLAGCSSAYDTLRADHDALATTVSQQASTIADLRSENITLRGFYNEYRARLDTTPETLATHEFEEAIRYATIRIELLTIRRQLGEERRLREAGDTAAIETGARNTEARLATVERTLRGYVDAEIVNRTNADAAINGTTTQLGQTDQNLRTRLERAEATLLELQRAEERRALDALDRARREGR